MAAFTRAASRPRVESCSGVNGVSSASSTLTLDRALGVANQSDVVSASDPPEEGFGGLSGDRGAVSCRTSLSTLLGHVLMMRFVRLRLEDRQQLRYEADRRIELNSVLYCRVLNNCVW